jgi:mitogen-activated protein kinase organizer 1
MLACRMQHPLLVHPPRHYPAHHAHLHPCQVNYSVNNDVLVSGGYDALVKLWDCRSRSVDPIQIIKGFRDSVTTCMISEK